MANFLDPRPGPERELLVRCARTHTDESAVARIQEITRQGVDWDLLLRLADQHGVMPLIHRTLIAMKKAAVPAKVAKYIESQFFANAARSLYAANQLVELMGALSAEGIRTIAFKGPVLAAWAYGDLAMRHFGDLDLLVHECDYARCGDFLRSRDFQLERDLGYETSFINQRSNICVDLHRGIAQSYWFCPIPLDFDSLWERRTFVTVVNVAVPSLRAEDLLVVLSVQMVRDTWKERMRFSKISDMAAILQAQRQLNWASVQELAASLGSERMVAYTLRLAEEFSQELLPENARRTALKGRPTAVPMAYARRQLCGLAGSSIPDRLLRVGFEFWVQKQVRDTLALRRLLGDRMVEVLSCAKGLALRAVGSRNDAQNNGAG